MHVTSREGFPERDAGGMNERTCVERIRIKSELGLVSAGGNLMFVNLEQQRQGASCVFLHGCHCVAISYQNSLLYVPN